MIDPGRRASTSRSSSAAMPGACAGFLWWNAAPAQIFMGDIGSLAIGGAMAGLALLTHTVLLLPILGGLYVVEIDERDRAGRLVPRASTGACCAWRRSTTTSRSGAGPSSR